MRKVIAACMCILLAGCTAKNPPKKNIKVETWSNPASNPEGQSELLDTAVYEDVQEEDVITLEEDLKIVIREMDSDFATVTSSNGNEQKIGKGVCMEVSSENDGGDMYIVIYE